mmetsp:Transcript_72648/g.201451  ORF Transcript_72648/g.201451 Transcript_72648/m.201451 type:complete len:250 (+) Transcript_72648:2031-2780(+)
MPHRLTSSSAGSWGKTSPCRLMTCNPTGLPGITKSWTVISPLVSVPVLSEQKTETQPRVSTASIFRTLTWRSAICFAAIISEIVTVGNNPSGTCANSAAELFCKISGQLRGVGASLFAMTLRMPTTMATTAMMCTKCSIWISSVDFTRDDLMPWAILPRKVESPIECTTHVALPFVTFVPKNAKFFDSAGETDNFACAVSLGSGTDSPVSAELSTSIPSVQWTMRTSAGTRLPASKKITSPGTRFSGWI